jgi:CheY-like chemotaxis protein
VRCLADILASLAHTLRKIVAALPEGRASTVPQASRIFCAQYFAAQFEATVKHAAHRFRIRDMLAPTDYEITEAESGEEALAAIAKQRPDLILMDIQLPIMDGYTAVRRIKADWHGA